jgi:hypothetical protein
MDGLEISGITWHGELQSRSGVVLEDRGSAVE